MALSANTARNYEVNEDPLLGHYPVKASSKIYEGSAVGQSSAATAGYARAMVALADKFLGFAVSMADNSAVATDGAINVQVRRRGTVTLSVTGVTGPNDVGTTVYASDDGTFTTTSTNNCAIGKIAAWVSGTNAQVRFEATHIASV